VLVLSPLRTCAEIRECVISVRLELYNQGVPCGPDAARRRLAELEVKPIPSRSTITRIMAEECLTHGRTGHYPGELFYVLWKGGPGCCRRTEKRRCAPPSAFGSPSLSLGDGLRSATLLREVPVQLRNSLQLRRQVVHCDIFPHYRGRSYITHTKIIIVANPKNNCR
jgi:hypothetical protein